MKFGVVLLTGILAVIVIVGGDAAGIEAGELIVDLTKGDIRMESTKMNDARCMRRVLKSDFGIQSIKTRDIDCMHRMFGL